MILLTVGEIIALHEKLIIETGGTGGIRDVGLLESAVYSTYSTFENIEQYPSIEEKSARLAFAIIKNHAFVDGNKRIGILVMLMTLKLNHLSLTYTQSELITLGLSLASGTIKFKETLDWIKLHNTPRV